ncbi:aminotransferase class IV [Pelagibacterales bacterium]|jgi:branched-chain amino acid aminotransferase|nr:aminotransferase class IV [Pelagibacterales bacterium]
MIIYANGKYTSQKKLTFDISDRGLLLGDGVFDTMLYQNNELTYYNDHYKRLKTAAKLLSFNFNLTNEQLKNIITNLIKKNNFQNKQIAIRTNITRGVSKRGLDFDKSHKVGIYIKLNLIPKSLFMKSIKLGIANIRRNSTSPISQNKTLNYLDNVIEKNRAAKNGYEDAIFLNINEKVSCTTTSNIFYVQKNKIYTPPLKDGVLNGVMREQFLKKKIASTQTTSLNNLLKSDYIFLTNSVFGIRPVKTISGSRKTFEGSKKFYTKLIDILGNKKII